VNYVLVGLNISRNPAAKIFSNFHDSNPRGQDYKLRRVIDGTSLWGAYLTDIIKDHKDVDSSNVMERIRNDPQLLSTNVEGFRNEMSAIGAKNPILVALGGATYRLLQDQLGRDFKVVKMTHYAHRISETAYKNEVWEMLEKLGDAPKVR
jgi:hypothetical protein